MGTVVLRVYLIQEMCYIVRDGRGDIRNNLNNVQRLLNTVDTIALLLTVS